MNILSDGIGPKQEIKTNNTLRNQEKKRMETKLTHIYKKTENPKHEQE